MTKEIIIDGCNVAECEFLRKCEIPYNEGCAINNSLCCDVRNCYFKQLQRLKRENENYKREINDFFITHNFLEQTDKYKRTLEEIREIAKHHQFYDPRYFMMRGDIGQIQNIKMTEIYKKCNEVLDEK